MDYREQFELGINEFNNGQFFECHDTFEEIWMDARGDRKRFLQGLIQTAVGIFHATRGNFRGANSQLTKGIDKLSAFPSTYHGVELAPLLASLASIHEEVQRLLESGEEVESIDLDLIPTISYTFDPSVTANW